MRNQSLAEEEREGAIFRLRGQHMSNPCDADVEQTRDWGGLVNHNWQWGFTVPWGQVRTREFGLFLMKNRGQRDGSRRITWVIAYLPAFGRLSGTLEPLSRQWAASPDEVKLKDWSLVPLELFYPLPRKWVARTCPRDNGMQMTWKYNNINIMKQCKPVGPPVEKDSPNSFPNCLYGNFIKFAIIKTE